MAKRGANVQLTNDNWDQEEEAEQAGHFKQAGDKEISKRIIKKARRRVAGSETSSGFKGFQGFGSPNLTSTSSPLTSSNKGFRNLSTVPQKKEPMAESSNDVNGADSQYLKQLKTLNLSVCEWIKKHVSQDPHVDLSPVFKDYEKHLANINKKFTSSKNKAVDSEVEMKVTKEVLSMEPPKFTHFQTTANSSVTSTSSLNGGASSSSAQANESKSYDATVETPEDAPKKDSLIRSAPEQDSFYSIRCKLFFKRATSWSELGVGMLSLKKVNNKTQVLMRNDTALGKILLNVFLGEATPISRYGKNNVLLMSIPNPPVFTKDSDGDNSKPVSYLIRVKTSENADELHKQMETSKEST